MGRKGSILPGWEYKETWLHPDGTRRALPFGWKEVRVHKYADVYWTYYLDQKGEQMFSKPSCGRPWYNATTGESKNMHEKPLETRMTSAEARDFIKKFPCQCNGTGERNAKR